MPLSRYWRLLVEYLRPEWARVLLLAALLFGGIGLQLVSPQVIRYFIDTTQSGGPQSALLFAAAAFIAVALAQRAANLATVYVGESVGWAATNALRADLALHCLRLDMPFHKRRTPGEMIERIDGDVNALANLFSQLVIRVLGNGLLIVGILLFLYREDWRLGTGLAIYAAVALAAMRAVQNLATDRWALERQSSAELFGFLEERIAGTEDIRACGAEPHVLRRLHQLMRVLLERARTAQMASNLILFTTSSLSALGYALGLGLGAYLYTQGQVTIGTAYLVVYYVGMLAGPLDHIRGQVQHLARARASVDRVEELFHFQPEVREVARAVLPGGALAVEFRSVTFGYDRGDPALDDVTFRLRPGRVLGLLGRTGSGKTTLTRLLFRLYDPIAGAIQLSGVSLSDVGLADLRERVGMVTQDVQLFQGTVRENLTFFSRRIFDDEIERALRALGLWEWVQALPAGLDTRIGAGGQGFSAGEAQLLAFTRVFLKDPGLVILDEASSRLDPATEQLLERAVDRLMSGRTGIVIAHRLQTVQRADEIMVLEGGRVVEHGARSALAADPASRFHALLRTGAAEALV